MLAVVETDSTFVWHPETRQEGYDVAGVPSRVAPYGLWVGRCIHCNTKLVVTARGETDATLEHIRPLCDGGDATDPQNCALACSRCNNEKGIRHDMHVGKGGRADEVVDALVAKRLVRWR